jgi:hypothetical protein
VDVWFDYRRVWARYPLLRVYFVIVIVVFALAIYGTATGTLLAVLFIPALAGAYIHHLMAMKRLDQ